MWAGPWCVWCGLTCHGLSLVQVAAGGLYAIFGSISMISSSIVVCTGSASVQVCAAPPWRACVRVHGKTGNSRGLAYIGFEWGSGPALCGVCGVAALANIKRDSVGFGEGVLWCVVCAA